MLRCVCRRMMWRGPVLIRTGGLRILRRGRHRVFDTGVAMAQGLVHEVGVVIQVVMRLVMRVVLALALALVLLLDLFVQMD